VHAWLAVLSFQAFSNQQPGSRAGMDLGRGRCMKRTAPCSAGQLASIVHFPLFRFGGTAHGKFQTRWTFLLGVLCSIAPAETSRFPPYFSQLKRVGACMQGFAASCVQLFVASHPFNSRLINPWLINWHSISPLRPKWKMAVRQIYIEGAFSNGDG
jgi:hypothetical protein